MYILQVAQRGFACFVMFPVEKWCFEMVPAEVLLYAGIVDLLDNSVKINSILQ
jgi:hypothetical protein